MLHYNKLDISKGTDLTKSNYSKECMVCHYSYFFHVFKFKNSVCNSCYDLTILCPSLRGVAIITVKGVDYCYIIHDISKSKAVHLLENSILEDHG